MGGEHQHLCFQNGGVAQRDVDSHLVTIEVSVESCAAEGVQTDGLAFDEARLEGLDTQTVKGRSTVQENRMTLQYVFQNVPNDGVLTVNNLLCGLDSLDDASFQNLADDERFEKFGGHVLRKTALVHAEVGADHNNRTSRIVHTFTEQVLTETTLLAFQAVGKGLEYHRD